jgi:hypothetical protein
MSLLISDMAQTKPHKDRDGERKRIELWPDAWARFERFVQDMAKAGPQHRVAKHMPQKRPRPKRDVPKPTEE